MSRSLRDIIAAREIQAATSARSKSLAHPLISAVPRPPQRGLAGAAKAPERTRPESPFFGLPLDVVIHICSFVSLFSRVPLHNGATLGEGLATHGLPPASSAALRIGGNSNLTAARDAGATMAQLTAIALATVRFHPRLIAARAREGLQDSAKDAHSHKEGSNRLNGIPLFEPESALWPAVARAVCWRDVVSRVCAHRKLSAAQAPHACRECASAGVHNTERLVPTARLASGHPLRLVCASWAPAAVEAADDGAHQFAQCLPLVSPATLGTMSRDVLPLVGVCGRPRETSAGVDKYSDISAAAAEVIVWEGLRMRLLHSALCPADDESAHEGGEASVDPALSSSAVRRQPLRALFAASLRCEMCDAAVGRRGSCLHDACPFDGGCVRGCICAANATRNDPAARGGAGRGSHQCILRIRLAAPPTYAQGHLTSDGLVCAMAPQSLTLFPNALLNLAVVRSALAAAFGASASAPIAHVQPRAAVERGSASTTRNISTRGLRGERAGLFAGLVSVTRIVRMGDGGLAMPSGLGQRDGSHWELTVVIPLAEARAALLAASAPPPLAATAGGSRAAASREDAFVIESGSDDEGDDCAEVLSATERVNKSSRLVQPAGMQLAARLSQLLAAASPFSSQHSGGAVGGRPSPPQLHRTLFCKVSFAFAAEEARRGEGASFADALAAHLCRAVGAPLVSSNAPPRPKKGAQCGGFASAREALQWAVGCSQPRHSASSSGAAASSSFGVLPARLLRVAVRGQWRVVAESQGTAALNAIGTPAAPAPAAARVVVSDFDVFGLTLRPSLFDRFTHSRSGVGGSATEPCARANAAGGRALKRQRCDGAGGAGGGGGGLVSGATDNNCAFGRGLWCIGASMVGREMVDSMRVFSLPSASSGFCQPQTSATSAPPHEPSDTNVLAADTWFEQIFVS